MVGRNRCRKRVDVVKMSKKWTVGGMATKTGIPHHSKPEPQHTRVNEGGGGAQKRKKQSLRDVLPSVEGWIMKK